ncbi:Protein DETOXIFICATION 12 [Glycine soja]
MEESLVKKHEEDRVVRWGVYSEEMRRICEIAGPMVAVVSSQYLLQVVSTMIVGHLGELYLSSAALAISLSGVTGFSLHMGMASGLETICGQAYGAQQYQRIGMQTYTAIFSLILVSIPVSILWINMESILVFIGQDPLISHEAGKFTIWLVPALFAYAILQPLVRYFQVQSLLLPMFASSCVTLIIHVPLCWALVFKTRLSNVGGALAVSISIWSNVIFLGLYMRYSSACAKTRAPISMELFKGMWEFFRFAIPSAVMGCYQIHNLKLQFYLLNTISTLYMIPFGIGAAASTRVSNELGAGNSHAARVAVLAAMSLAVIETSIVSATLFACRNVYGYIFSNEKEVIDYVTVMAPLVCISIILDSIQGVLTGIARGCGWQHLGVFVNLGAFYLCGIPMAALLAFLVRLGGQGLWIGIQSGAFVQTLLLSIITGCINWEKQAIKARKRLFDDQFSADNILDSEPENPSASAITWTVFSQEMKRVGYLAAPMITVTLSQYFLQIISMMMVGHLGKLALSSTAIAISLCAVSGFSLIFGMSCALETQCGQAYGAQQYRKFGVQIYTAIVSLTLACLPLTLFWVYLEKILIFLGQDPSISQEAGKFALCMIPALFAYATLQALIRFFLMQSLISPLVISSSITLCFHVAFSWLMVFKSGFGNLGAAFSIGTSYWLNVILLGLYMKFSTECERTRVPISMELFHGIGEFFTYAIPSAGMSLKLQSYPYVYPSSQLSTQSQKQLAQQQGAGSPQSARVSVSAAMTLAVSEAILVSSIIFASRQVLGYVFSNEQDVVDYVTDMVPLLSISVIVDTLHGTLSGIARGCGWQHIGAYVNLGAYYVVGIPMAAILGFWLQLRGKGLWIGILTGAFCQTIMLSLITSCTNWEKQFGMSCALETQCGQAYGAQQYRKFGVQIYTAIVSLTLACLPLTLLWVYLGKILIFLGQDPLISQEAGKFALCMIPALFAYATLQALVRYFLMQSLTSPLFISSSITLCFHVAFCWLLVFKCGFGNLGAAFSIGTSYWLNVVLLGLYMKFSTECEKTRVPISMELFHGIGEFFRCAIPSAGMICLEWWSFELLTLLSGLLPNPELETSVLSICLSVTTTIYTIPEAIGSAASTRVSNALGAGSPQSAQLSVSAAMTLAASAAILVSSIIFACRQVVGYVFSSELDVVDYFTDMVPLLCLSVILDTLHGTLSGIARGCGWQHLGAYVNLGAYYVVGIPIAAMLGFWVQLRGKGLWIGILTGAFCQTVMLSLITSCTNWEKQAIKARERTFQRSFAVEDGLVLTNGEDSLNLSACLVGIGKSSNFGGTKDQNLELEEGKVLITRQV